MKRDFPEKSLKYEKIHKKPTFYEMREMTATSDQNEKEVNLSF